MTRNSLITALTLAVTLAATADQAAARSWGHSNNGASTSGAPSSDTGSGRANGVSTLDLGSSR